MTCKDCIHYDVCSYRSQVELCNDYPSENCKDFRECSCFIKIPSPLKKGDKLYYCYFDIIEKEWCISNDPDIVTSVSDEGFFVSPTIYSDGTFYPTNDFYWWEVIGNSYFLTKKEAESELKKRNEQ